MRQLSSAVLSALALVSVGVRIFHPARQLAQNRAANTSGAAPDTTFRIVFGIGDREATPWDGGITASSARTASIQGVRFAGNDTADGKSSWIASTRHGVSQGRLGSGREEPDP